MKNNNTRSDLMQILSPRFIQETAREMWQQHHDDDMLHMLEEHVADEVAKELYVLMWPEESIPDGIEDLPPKIQDIVVTLVAESFDIDALNREARENSEDLHDIELARQGRY